MTARHLFGLLIILFLGTLVALLGVHGGPAGQDRAPRAIAPTLQQTPPDVTDAGAVSPDSTPLGGGPPPLPSVFYGAAEIRGHVVDPAGNPSASTRVGCQPVSFALLAPAERHRFETTTDERGWFDFSDLPSDRGFVITATQGLMSVTVFLGRKEIPTPVRLQLSPVTYERYRFLDANGPVPVSFVPDVFLGGGTDVLWTTLAQQACQTWVLERLGATELHVTPGEVAIVYSDTIPALRTAPRTFRADGYEPVVLTTALRPLTEWPACSDVRVNRMDDGRLLYKVVPPTIESGLAETDTAPPSVYIESDEWAHCHRVTPEHRAFLEMPTVTIKVHLEDRAGCAELLNYVTEVDGEGATVIRPQYPELAFICVTYDIVERDLFDSVICVTRTGWVHTGVSLYPGKVSFGPLPVDSYEFRILRPAMGIPRVLKAWGPIVVTEGFNALQWPD